MPDSYTTPDELMRDIYLAIYAALESRLHLIGSVLDADSRKEILAKQIYDKGDFLDRVVIFNGLRWTVGWSGEADGLFTVVISTEFSGVTSNKIFLLKDIPAAAI